MGSTRVHAIFILFLVPVFSQNEKWDLNSALKSDLCLQFNFFDFIFILCLIHSQQEFDHKWTSAFNHWIFNCTTFVVYFQKQWVEGRFHDWNVFSSAVGCATAINCVKGFKAMLKRCFMEWKQYKFGKCSGFSTFYYLYPFKNFVITV
jgi:hypothetical protein